MRGDRQIGNGLGGEEGQYSAYSIDSQPDKYTLYYMYVCLSNNNTDRQTSRSVEGSHNFLPANAIAVEVTIQIHVM